MNPEANAKPATGNVHSRAAVGIGIHLEPAAQLVPSFPGTALYLLFTPLSAQGYSHQGYLFCLEAGALTLETPDCFQAEPKTDISLVMRPARRKANSCRMVGKGGKTQVSGAEPIATLSVHLLFQLSSLSI